MSKVKNLALVVGFLVVNFAASSVLAQEMLPPDNGEFGTYHTAPAYRESESHPFRLIAYVVHPVGWLLREGIFRPLSYFASSTETRRSVMGYRDPYSFRGTECALWGQNETPDCRNVVPFSTGFEQAEQVPPVIEDAGSLVPDARQVYFPNVNFDFNARRLNDLGRGRARQIADLVKNSGDVKIVLEGHTDYMGSDAYNQKLGMDRAEAVLQELVALGMPAERLSAVSFGESKPLFSEQEDWARALNRRVEVKVGSPAVEEGAK